ncbi:MAG: aldo/keto reductase [Candidatus Lokiarchaeota archaeon]|nr:aldo/keto reductase [Candidatus Lokiarchaeota archaeon]MBD3200661.1 aldo/keto reductase [Candidatus Lokiarchaeota archaeon]
MDLKLNSTMELNNGVKIPRLGFGTWELEREEALNPVKWALEIGYRLIDTAAIYANEKFVGKAIKESGIDRNKLFITSKVWNTDQGYEKTLKAFDASLNRLDLTYLDLYLIHWPHKLSGETWKALEEIYNDNRVKAIGVSNFSINGLEDIINNYDIVPTINQIAMHPLKYKENRDLIAFCKERNIKIEAYSPLTHGVKLDYNKFKEAADKYNKSVPQILLRWSIQHDFVCIPRSGNKQHIKENVEIFDFQLDEDDMRTLNTLK